MATNSEKIVYIPKFYGGISDDIRNGLKYGKFYNSEEVDIYSSKDYVQPVATMINDSVTGYTNFSDYTLGDTGILYALCVKTSGNVAAIYKKVTPSGATPSAWASVIDCTVAPAAQGYSPLSFFKTTESSVVKKYLYYHTAANKLSRYGDINGAPTETTVFGTLSGLTGTTSEKLCHVVDSGTLFIANGNYIAEVTSQGNFIDKAYTLPTGLVAVDMTPFVLSTGGDYMAILCQDSLDPNHSIIILWDKVATSGFLVKIIVSNGNPQWIQRFGSYYLVSTLSSDGNFRIYQLNGVNASGVPLFDISNTAYATTRPISPVNSKAMKSGVFYFGLEKTDKTAIYAIGETIDNLPALTLYNRYATTDYSKHKPYASMWVNNCFYSSFSDNGTDKEAAANESAPTYSTQAVLETLLTDAGQPFNDKQFKTLQIGTKKIPTGCSIGLQIRNNEEDTYADLNTTKSTDDIVNSRNMEIPIDGYAGREVQIKLTFNSAGTLRPALEWLGVRYLTSEIW